jgi:uncharacterized protein (TIGR02391 family)
MDDATRQRIVDLLAKQSGGSLYSFFAAHGLGPAYRLREKDSKAAKVAEALTDADSQGRLDTLLQDAAIRFGAATASGTFIKPLGKLRHELEDLWIEVHNLPRDSIHRSQVDTWVAAFNELLENLRVHAGDETPEPIMFPQYYYYGNNYLTVAGILRLKRAAQRAIDLVPAKTERVTPELDARLEALHAGIRRAAKPRLLGGHGDNAVEEACKVVAKRVRDMSGLQGDGVALMTTAFSPRNPLVKLNSLQTQSEQDEQLGYMHLAAGLMAAGRNPRAHRPSADYDEDVVLELLALASMIMRRLDAVT